MVAEVPPGRNHLFFVVTEDWYFVSHRLPLAIAAREVGYDVTVVTRVRRHGDHITGAGLRLIPFENVRGGTNPIRELATVLRLAGLYHRERPDIVHHVAIKPVLYGSIAARLARVPKVINAVAGMGLLLNTSDGGLARWFKHIIRWSLGKLLRSGTTLVQNRDDERLLVEMGVPAGQVRRIAGSGVDLRKFGPEVEAVGMSDDPPVVLLPARLLWDKGVGEFVSAARILRDQKISARFVLAGEPDRANPSAVPASEISQWVEEGVVEHSGWVEDMGQMLAKSHVVCLPSYYGEGIPKSLIEAAAAARPIVTTDMPGCREIVRHGDNGLLVPPRNPVALAAALGTLIGDAALRRKMGARGRDLAEEEFGLERIIGQTLAVYEEVAR